MEAGELEGRVIPGTVGQVPWVQTQPCPWPKAGATTGWALVTSRSWVWAPRVWTLFLHLCRLQQVCFPVEEEALTCIESITKQQKENKPGFFVLLPEPWACVLVEVPGSCWFVLLSERIIASLVSRCVRCILDVPGG